MIGIRYRIFRFRRDYKFFFQFSIYFMIIHVPLPCDGWLQGCRSKEERAWVGVPLPSTNNKVYIHFRACISCTNHLKRAKNYHFFFPQYVFIFYIFSQSAMDFFFENAKCCIEMKLRGLHCTSNTLKNCVKIFL